jgi:Tfp pilus assembly protein PilZ
MNDEKRATDRVATNLPARWHGISGEHEGRIEDLSLTGCFVNTTRTVDVGEMVSLLIQLPSGAWLPLRGKVMFFHQMTGFSVAFAPHDEKTRERLDELIAAQDHTR